jgi:hypothetical protein
VKAFVQLSLALAAHAMSSKSAAGKRKPFNPDTAKYACRIFLKLLGLVGDEFKTCRHHLTTGLAGCSNYRGVKPTTTPATADSEETDEVADAAAQ